MQKDCAAILSDKFKNKKGCVDHESGPLPHNGMLFRDNRHQVIDCQVLFIVLFVYEFSSYTAAE